MSHNLITDKTKAEQNKISQNNKVIEIFLRLSFILFMEAFMWIFNKGKWALILIRFYNSLYKSFNLTAA